MPAWPVLRPEALTNLRYGPYKHLGILHVHTHKQFGNVRHNQSWNCALSWAPASTVATTRQRDSVLDQIVLALLACAIYWYVRTGTYSITRIFFYKTETVEV